MISTAPLGSVSLGVFRCSYEPVVEKLAGLMAFSSVLEESKCSVRLRSPSFMESCRWICPLAVLLKYLLRFLLPTRRYIFI